MFAQKGNMNHAFLERWNLKMFHVVFRWMSYKDKNFTENRTEKYCKSMYRHSKMNPLGIELAT